MGLPVHWFNLISGDYTINKDYMSRTKQIVDWALDAELYVIMHIHHDEKIFLKICQQKQQKL